MNQRCVLVLLLACGVVAADPERDLKFAQGLGARGMKAMALKVLNDLENSSDPVAARAGRFGKAQLTKSEADVARRRFLRALGEQSEPPVTRERVIELYKDAAPKIEEYVKARPDNDDARFLLGELLQEYAEFLTGANYPDAMADVHAKLVSDNKQVAAKLFESAIASFDKVKARLTPLVRENAEFDDPNYIRLSQADFNAGRTKFRWACIYPKGPNFQHRVDEAVEVLDDFLQRHYDEAFGAYAMIYLGRCFYEKATRLGDADEGDVALNYFENVYAQVEEIPAAPQTSDIIGESFYWYARTCNLLALGQGNLKKPQPIYFQNAAKASAMMDEKLKHGAKREWALRARLEFAEGEAAQRNFTAAVATAGDVLAAARVEGHGVMAKLATLKLTSWVGNVRGSGALDPGLLFQIGSSLLAQGRTSNAITFFEKAIAASTTEDEKEKIAFPAQLEIARAYRTDKRYFAAAKVAMGVVDLFLKGEGDADSDLGLTAAEACNQARLSWRAIKDATKSSTDESAYQTIVDTFRSKFPSHPANSDKAYGVAIEAFTGGNLEEAATLFKEIPSNSPNYWRAQRRVPQCYRVLAQKEKDPEASKGWHNKSLAAATELLKAATGKPEDDARKGEQYGRLYKAMSEASLGMWKESLADIGIYLEKYPGKFVKRGLEIKIQIDGHLAMGDLDKAEASLKALKEKQPQSPYIPRSNVDLYSALLTRYKETATGATRTSMAGRAANLWQAHLARLAEDKLTQREYFALGDVLRDAGRFQEAGEAFDAAGGLSVDPKRKAFFTLQAAEMTFKAAVVGKANKTITAPQYIKILKKTRQLFTDVLIPNKNIQKPTTDALANWKSYPKRATFNKIKRSPAVLLTTAEVYNESAQGVDGRWIAVRLIDHLHSFTLPVKDDSKPALAALITIWWDGAELKLNIFKSIAASGGGQAARAGRSKGYAFAKKIIFQYVKMDGPERVARIKALAEELK